MKKILLYKYLGTNGTLITPIHLPNVYCVKEYDLIADENKQLTKDGKNFFMSIKVPYDDVDKWYEVEA